MRTRLRYVVISAVATLLVGLCAFTVTSANAAPYTISFPTGLVCQNSAVNVDVADNARLVTRTLTSADGTVRALSAGTGSDLVVYNPNHPDTRISLHGNGSVGWATTASDGTTTSTLTGHNIVFYFPTDKLLGGAPGPATLLVVGREVIDIDAAGNFTQLSETGSVTDICAQLPAD